MFNKIKLKYLNNRNFIRIIRYSLISILLLILSWLIDYKYPFLKNNFPSILLLSQEVSSSFLSTLSGTFLTVTTFTFTTILTVIGKYSGSFTPRIVQDFIDKPNVLSLVGVYVGGFFYTVLALFMVQNIERDDPLLCGTIAIFYAVAAMVSFILFVRRVLKDIKVSNVIENVYQNAYKLIEDESKRRKESERFKEDDGAYEIKIYANETGFIYEIDSSALLNKLKDIKCELVIEKKIGQYVSKGMYIGKIYLFKNPKLEGEDKDEFLNELSSYILINVSKNDFKDYHHEVTNLTEIAMMALSPGVNDPNTAIECIRKIAVLLGKLFSTENSYVVLKENENCKIIYIGYTVKEELYNSFSQIIFYGKEDPMVARAILGGIYLIYTLADVSVKKDVKDFIDYVYKICLEAMATDYDREIINMIYEDFKQNRDKQLDEDALKEEE